MTPGRGRRSVDSDSTSTRSPTAKAIATPHRTHYPSTAAVSICHDGRARFHRATLALGRARAGSHISCEGRVGRTAWSRAADARSSARRSADPLLRSHSCALAQLSRRVGSLSSARRLFDCGGSHGAKGGVRHWPSAKEPTSLLHGFQGPSPRTRESTLAAYRRDQRGKQVAASRVPVTVTERRSTSGASCARSAPGRSRCPSARRSGVPVTRGLRRHC
jgi:hypothetical protein